MAVQLHQSLRHLARFVVQLLKVRVQDLLGNVALRGVGLRGVAWIHQLQLVRDEVCEVALPKVLVFLHGTDGMTQHLLRMHLGLNHYHTTYSPINMFVLILVGVGVTAVNADWNQDYSMATGLDCG